MRSAPVLTSSKALLGAALLVVLTACGESRQELYMQGMKHEGDAERGPCKLLHDKQAGASLLSGDQVQQCLQMQSEAVALYDRAAALGLTDADFVQTHTQARARVERLEGMLKTIRSLERPELDPPAPAAGPADVTPGAAAKQ